MHVNKTPIHLVTQSLFWCLFKEYLLLKYFYTILINLLENVYLSLSDPKQVVIIERKYN
jgi:hypothetical protein